jgi:prepilin-type processing-associated H-X9-DG protein/prepilin-type N-terminal cleavage/methylation domain-containing protein
MSSGHSSHDNGRIGFTVLELLVSVAIIGVLAGILLPAIMWARESARRTHCVNNLRQIGVTIQQYHDTAQRLPEAWTQASDGISGYGWAVALLPYFEETTVSRNISRHLPITAAPNKIARESDLQLMRCPSDISEASFELYAEDEHSVHDASENRVGDEEALSLARLPTANYAGVFGTLEADDSFPAPPGDGPIVSDHRVRFEDLERGLSHTLVVGERTTAMVPTTWFGVDFRGEDAACRLVGSAMTAPSCDVCDECEFASRHSGGANFVWGDGHVSLVSSDIEAKQYRQFAKRSAD